MNYLVFFCIFVLQFLNFFSIKLFLNILILLCGVVCSIAQNTCSVSAGSTYTVNACNHPKNQSIVATGNLFEAPGNGTTCFGSSTCKSNSRDTWIKFNATNATASVVVTSTVTDRNIAIVSYSMPCVSNLVTNTTAIGCVDATDTYTAQTETLVLTSLTPGTDYLVRIIAARASSSSIPSITVKVSVISPHDNDEPTGATDLGTPNSTCTYLPDNLKTATATTCGGLSSPPCGNWGSNSVDLWYKVTVPAGGDLFLQTAGIYTGNSLGMAVYSGSPCSSLSLIKCSEGNPEESTSNNPALFIQGQTPGNVLYVRVWNKNSATDPCNFSICATTNGPCGNVQNLNDNCEDSYAIYTSGVTNTMVAVGYTGTPTYTQDSPGNLDLNYCSYAAPNSWYSFVATNTTESIPFTTASGCAIEASIFSVSTNTYGCCKSFINTSNTYSSCPNTYSVVNSASTATLISNGLTVGQTYYMLITYPNGAACNFSVTGWAYTGVLALDFVSFTAQRDGNTNKINWIVESESKINGYTLEHSNNGIDFYPIYQVNAKGNYTNTHYEAYDTEVFKDITYYRVKVKMKDGSENYTNIISVLENSDNEKILNIHPNPTTSNLQFEFYTKFIGNIDIELINFAGAVTYAQTVALQEGKNEVVLPISNLDIGVYILKVSSQKTGKITYHKVVKN